MKIFYPIDAFFPSQIGGPCNSVYWLTDELNKNNFETQIFTTTLGIENSEVESNVYLSKDYGSVYYDKNRNYLKKTFLIYKGVKNSQIVHLNGFFGKHSMLSYFISRIFFPKKSVLISARGELNKKALIYNSFAKKIVLGLYKLLSKKVFFHSTCLEETQDIKEVFEKAIVYELPNYFKIDYRIVKEHNDNKFLYIGRIHHKKAIHKIIEGFNMSTFFRDSGFKFVIAGQAEERHKEYYDSLVAKVEEFGLKDKIEFIGFINGLEKEKLYSSSYISLMLSETENFGNVVVESLNQGTPVIASKGTPWEILENYECGFHIDNSPESISKTIDKVLQLSSSEYTQMCKNAIRLVDENFLMKTKIINWINVYKTIYSFDTCVE